MSVSAMNRERNRSRLEEIYNPLPKNSTRTGSAQSGSSSQSSRSTLISTTSSVGGRLAKSTVNTVATPRQIVGVGKVGQQDKDALQRQLTSIRDENMQLRARLQRLENSAGPITNKSTSISEQGVKVERKAPLPLEVSSRLRQMAVTVQNLTKENEAIRREMLILRQDLYNLQLQKRSSNSPSPTSPSSRIPRPNEETHNGLKSKPAVPIQSNRNTKLTLQSPPVTARKPTTPAKDKPLSPALSRLPKKSTPVNKPLDMYALQILQAILRSHIQRNIYLEKSKIDDTESVEVLQGILRAHGNRVKFLTNPGKINVHSDGLWS